MCCRMAGQLCEQLTSWFFKFASSSCVCCKRRGTLRGLHLVEQVACRDERYIQVAPMDRADGRRRQPTPCARPDRDVRPRRSPEQPGGRHGQPARWRGSSPSTGGSSLAMRLGGSCPAQATDGAVRWSGARRGSDARWGSAGRG